MVGLLGLICDHDLNVWTRTVIVSTKIHDGTNCIIEKKFGLSHFFKQTRRNEIICLHSTYKFKKQIIHVQTLAILLKRLA